jgi:hypothetical protein
VKPRAIFNFRNEPKKEISVIGSKQKNKTPEFKFKGLLVVMLFIAIKIKLNAKKKT